MGWLKKTAKKVEKAIIRPIGDAIEAVVEDPVKLAAVALTIAAPTLAPTIGAALGATGTAATVVGNAVIGGTVAEATGESFIKGATAGAIGSALTPVASAASEAVGGGTLGNVASGAVKGATTAALKGGDVATGALTGGTGGLLSDVVTKGLDYSYADDAAQLAEQGLSSAQITQVLGEAGAPADVASNLAGYAVNAVGQGLMGDAAINYINNEFTNDAAFSAADAGQLFDQGLANKQVQDVLDATGQGDRLTSLGMDAEFIATDAQNIWNQTNNVAAVEQNLIATGVDPIVAAEVANQVAFGEPKDVITDSLLNAADPNTLTTDGTLFSEVPEIDPVTGQKLVKPAAQQPTQTMQQQSLLAKNGNLDNSLFLLDRSRYGDLGNPFLRSSASYGSIVKGIFG